jgi:PAS domain S-box-containing protein
MYRKRSIFLIVIILLMAFAGWRYANVRYRSRIEEEVHLQVSRSMLTYREAFRAAIEKRFALLEGLYAFAESLPEEELAAHFRTFAEHLYGLEEGIRNISIAPGGIQKYVFPLEGNEEVPGHNLLEDSRPEIRAAVQKTLDSRSIVLSGPYELRQGGEGLIARKAFFRDDQFRGLVTMVVDMPPIYRESGVDSAEPLILALRDSKNRTFRGSDAILALRPETLFFEAGSERWSISAVPSGGWEKMYRDESLMYLVTSLVVSLMAATIIILLIRRFSNLSESARSERQRYKDLFTSIKDTVIITDNNRTILDANQPALKLMFGYNTGELKGESTAILYSDKEGYGRTGTKIFTSESGKSSELMEVPFRRKDGSTFPAELSALKLHNSRGDIIGNVGIIRDITVQKQHERARKRQMERTQWLNELAALYLSGSDIESLLRNTLDKLGERFPGLRVAYATASPSGTLNVVYSVQPEEMPDMTGQVVDISPASEYLHSLQNTKKTVICDTMNDPITAPVKEPLLAWSILAMIGVAVPVEGGEDGLLCFESPGPKSWSEHELAAVEEHANLLTLILNNARYHSMLKAANASLAVSLEEKKTLLKEVHHRVKNNLNVIVSLLRLQEDEIGSIESAHLAFEESRKRIFSMALVHESLYRSENLSEIELDQYILALVRELGSSFSNSRRIDYTFALDPLRVDIGLAMPCGIIITELISNAHKHAFPDNREGTITVSLALQEASRFTLTVSDNGVGMPGDFAAEESASLGMNLVTALAAQIDGELSVDSEAGSGTVVSLRIPVNTLRS